MGVLKNGVGRPSNETIRKRNILKVVCIVLVLIIIGLICYILNDKGIIKINNDNKKVTEKNKVKEEKEVVLSDEEGNKIIEEVFGEVQSFEAYDKDTINTESFKTFAAIENTKKSDKKDMTCKELFGDKIKLWDGESNEFWAIPTAKKDVSLLCSDHDQDIYEYESVNKTYKKMYGENKNAYKGFADNPLGSSYGYSKSKNVYVFLSCECGGGFPQHLSGFKNIVKKGNTVSMEYAIVVNEDWNDYVILNDGTKVDLTVETSSDDLFEKYKDKIDTEYTLTFEKQKDGHYIFKEAK